MNAYQKRRREAERLDVCAQALSVAAGVLSILITAQAAGYDITIPLPG